MIKQFAAVLFISGGLTMIAAHPHGDPRSMAHGNGQADPPAFNLLSHDYREGEKIVYYMTATNRGRTETIQYSAQANGVVKKDPDGTFHEEYGWSHLVVNGKEMPLNQASLDLIQRVSIPPAHNVAMPNLAVVNPMLIGPITDLLTFYADLTFAGKGKALVHAGDHSYVEYGTPASWADGTYTILGQSSFDFDLTLQEIDAAKGTATLYVRHVPPAKPQIRPPAEWMNAPVADTPNNWVEVSRMAGGKYEAEIGKEIFNDTIVMSLKTGKIISASMDNPVEVLSRVCTDAALTSCEDPVRYQIRRQVEIHQ